MVTTGRDVGPGWHLGLTLGVVSEGFVMTVDDAEGAEAHDEAAASRALRRVPHDFDAGYQEETQPWDIGRPQAAFVRLVDAGEVRGRVLDVGCGTGQHALMAAAHGLEATGIDAAPTAIRLAREKAAQRSLETRFEVWDALDLPALGEQFDTVLDCGLFHVFDDDERIRFAAGLGEIVVPGGRYFVLCFSDKQPGDWGPRRIAEDELRRCFADGWQVDSITDAVLEINTTQMARNHGSPRSPSGESPAPPTVVLSVGRSAPLSLSTLTRRPSMERRPKQQTSKGPAE